MFALSVLTVLILAFQAYIYSRQRDLMEVQASLTREAIDESKKSSQRELRAYISAIKITAIKGGIFKIRDYRNWEVVIKNHGQTPAVGVRIKTGCDILPKRIEDFSELTKWDKEPDSSTDICPGEDVVVLANMGSEILDTPSHRFTDDEIMRASGRAGHPVLYIYGRIGFKDVFGTRITTTFCHFFFDDGGVGGLCHEKVGNETKYE